MKNKVIIALVDGMRPDGMWVSGHPFFERMKKESTCCFDAQTITRPITLPAHISLFTGVDHLHHENTDNDWHPYPVDYKGILESCHDAGLKTAMMVTWPPLMHLGKLESIDKMDYIRFDTPDKTFEDRKDFERMYAERTADAVRSDEYDFMFYYFEMADVVGHEEGWMSPHYIEALYCAGECLQTVYEALQPDQNFILMADHGGEGLKHNRPESVATMTIPVFMHGPAFEAGREAHGWNILDIAPTVHRLLGIDIPDTYQGRSVL